MDLDFSQQSLVAQLVTAFSGGFLTSLTPCVYPLIPVTLALFGANGECSRKKSFLLSVTFVFGITVTFTTLGIIASQTGALFGSVLAHPLVITVLSLLLVFLALYNLELFHLSWLMHIQSKASRVGGTGFLGAFLAGSVSGFVAAPCVGPILVSILVYVAQVGDIVYGSLLLSSYSLGMGVLFILLGTFSGLLSRIPRSGRWMSIVKFLLSSALLLVALFLLQPLLPSQWLNSSPSISFFILFLLLGGAFGFRGYIKNIGFMRALGALLVGSSLFFLLFTSPTEQTEPSQHKVEDTLKSFYWHSSLDDALIQAKAQRKYVMIDLYADWCAACKELEKITFHDPRVQEQLASFILVRIDFTTPNEETQDLSERYGILGLPWILFLTPDGEQIKEATLTGFIPAQDFLDHIESKIKQ